MSEVLEKPRHSTVEDLVVKFGKRAPKFDWVLRRLQTIDLDILYRLKEQGPLDRRVIKREYAFEGVSSIRRLKAYELIKAVRKKDRVRSYVLDLTQKGLAILRYETLLLKSMVHKGETVEKHNSR